MVSDAVAERYVSLACSARFKTNPTFAIASLVRPSRAHN